MKIRIKGNSVRIRLNRPEVDAFSESEYIEEKTEFGTGTFIYALQQGGKDTLTATFSGNKITMLIPEALIKEWNNESKVGFDANMDLGNGKSLYLLLEKDFKCLDETTEDQSENFDNPLLARS